jgi:two-component SAPR family response regulator
MYFFFVLLFRFLHEEPERLDYTIKKCKRLTTMLYQLKRLAINQEQKSISTKSRRQFSFSSNGKSVDRQRLLEQIESVTQNSDGRIKAIEVS